jgi:hypothetical protein
LPQESVAVQVRVTDSELPQPSKDTSTWVTVALPDASVAVALPVAAGLVSPLHSIVTSAGRVRTGAVVSCTVMTCEALAELPHASVAVHVRVSV